MVSGHSRPTIVLAHGAFADSSGFQDVIRRLLAAGYPVVAAPNPLRGVASDAAGVKALLDRIEGPIVLVGHSYGGAVISAAAAGSDNVRALVYLAAFMPDTGEAVEELVGPDHPARDAGVHGGSGRGHRPGGRRRLAPGLRLAPGDHCGPHRSGGPRDRELTVPLRRRTGLGQPLAAGDSLALPPEVAAYLDRLRSIGASPRMVEAERDGWILVAARWPGRVVEWMPGKIASIGCSRRSSTGTRRTIRGWRRPPTSWPAWQSRHTPPAR
ncbi:alpha/beta fold hydrolase [Micromonospora sp. CA-240977]|uniref:alpha/beta hydrolase n=1 Tax=Micromonospora sp. CA-240977 TaxID=3239957 RepID=UPI003D93454D